MPVGFPRRRGVTLIEAVLFISVALGLIVGGIVFFQQAQTAQRTQATVRLITSLLTETRSLLRNQNLPGNATVHNVLVAAGSVPGSALLEPPVGTRCLIKSAWGECISLFVRDDGEAFVLNMHQVPTEICSRLVIFDDTGHGALGTGIIRVRIMSASANWKANPAAIIYTDQQVHSLDTDGALDPATAGGLCATLNQQANPALWIEAEME